jgi:hypothetical protein
VTGLNRIAVIGPLAGLGPALAVNALALTGAFALLLGGGAILRWHRRRQAPERVRTPAPGQHPGGGAPVSPPIDNARRPGPGPEQALAPGAAPVLGHPGPEPAHPPAPAPGLTPRERAHLDAIGPLPPPARENGKHIADSLRRILPHLTDAELGRVCCFLHFDGQAIRDIMPTDYWALTVHLDGLAAAALDLTALERDTEVPR